MTKFKFRLALETIKLNNCTNSDYNSTGLFSLRVGQTTLPLWKKMAAKPLRKR